MISLIMSTASARAPQYEPCIVDKYNYKALANQSFPIVPALTQSPVTVSGNVYLIDGCTFGVRDFIFINGDESYWYGGYKGSSDGITLSKQYVYASAFPSSVTFALDQTPGAQASFNGFDQFRLFSKYQNVIVGSADIPTISGSATGSGTQAGAAPSGTKKSTGNSVGSEGIFNSLVMMFSFLL